MKQMFILMNGFSKSGKTSLAKKIEKKYNFVRIGSDDIRSFLERTYDIFQDDSTVTGKSFKLKGVTSEKTQSTLVNTLVEEGINVIWDSTTSLKSKREWILKDVKDINPNIITIILSMNTEDEVIMERLKESDKKLEQEGEKPAWVDLYEKIQKPRFTKPTKDEANYVFFVNDGNEKEVLNKIKGIVN